MPFDERFSDVYELAIKPACEAAGAHAQRIDEQYFEHDILDRIYMQIDKADLIVADLTDLNPNVFYEVGYAHALGKRAVLLTSGKDELPFDLTHYPHIVYGNRLAQMKSELRDRVGAALVEKKSGPTKKSSDLKAYYRGRELTDNPQFIYHGVGDRMRYNSLQLDIHHAGLRFMDTIRLQIGLSASGERVSLGLEKQEAYRVELGSGESLCISRDTHEIFPGGWKTVQYRFRAKECFGEGEVLQFTLRLSSTVGAAVARFCLVMADVEEISL